MLVLPSDIGPPNAITLLIKSPVWGPDLTTATAFSLNTRRSDGTAPSPWVGTIISATPRELLAQYSLQVGDITVTGPYRLAPRLATPGGIVPCYTVGLFVTTPFDTAPIFNDETWIASTTTIDRPAAVQFTWTSLVGPGTFNLSPFRPHIRYDASGGPIVLNLWTPIDGDEVVINDYLGTVSAVDTMTLNASAGTNIPISPPGTYGPSGIQIFPNTVYRLKFDAATGFWLNR